MVGLISILSLSFLLSGLAESHYTMVEDLTTVEGFWDGFDFFTGPDPTNGHVKFLSMADANATELAGIVVTETGPKIYLGVDTKSVTPNGRPSTRLTSKKTHNHALWIMDVHHAPIAPAGLWPALWLLGTSSLWPAAGEIDIYEQISGATHNRVTAHTKSGVAIANDTSSMADGSTILTTNCDVQAPNQSKNQGCAIDQPEDTFGETFNKNGGGVFAVEYNSTGIYVWFFPRKNLPTSINFADPESTATWPKPNAAFQGTFDTDKFFCDMQIILDTTTCGEWAGDEKVWSDFKHMAPSCNEYVTNHPEAFTEAYWLLGGIRVYEDMDDSSYPDSGSNSTGSASTNTTS